MSDRVAVSNSFRADEVHAVHTLLTRLLMGGDCTQLVRSPALRRAHAKFLRMREKLVDDAARP